MTTVLQTGHAGRMERVIRERGFFPQDAVADRAASGGADGPTPTFHAGVLTAARDAGGKW